jgi:hypothetical protein
MDIDAVCEAIAAGVTAAQLTVAGKRVTATAFAPDSVTEPHFFCAEFDGVYDQTFAGLTELTLTCRLLVSRADDVSGQSAVRALASTGSATVSAALLALRGAPGQPALSGAADDLHLRRVRGPRLYEVALVNYYGVEFTIFVMG